MKGIYVINFDSFYAMKLTLHPLLIFENIKMASII